MEEPGQAKITNNFAVFNLVWYQHNIAQPECKARIRIPVESQLYVLANHYHLTRTNLLPAYMADWILHSK
jgi:hypothetical protein